MPIGLHPSMIFKKKKKKGIDVHCSRYSYMADVCSDSEGSEGDEGDEIQELKVGYFYGNGGGGGALT